MRARLNIGSVLQLCRRPNNQPTQQKGWGSLSWLCLSPLPLVCTRSPTRTSILVPFLSLANPLLLTHTHTHSQTHARTHLSNLTSSLVTSSATILNSLVCVTTDHLYTYTYVLNIHPRQRLLGTTLNSLVMALLHTVSGHHPDWYTQTNFLRYYHIYIIILP